MKKKDVTSVTFKPGTFDRIERWRDLRESRLDFIRAAVDNECRRRTDVKASRTYRLKRSS